MSTLALSTARPFAACVLAGGLLLAGAPGMASGPRHCPDGMRPVAAGLCVDAYEASVLELGPGGRVTAHPYYTPVAGLRVRAVSKKGAYPQGYISRNEAEAACKASKKRLCKDAEWVLACRGPGKTRYPYGDERRDGVCNDHGISPLDHFFGARDATVDPYTWESMNDPRLNRLPGGLARAGAKHRCRNGFGLYDMVGNLHEWTSDPNGTFRGGYYLDTKINGEGCAYQTTAHNATYHDYSTGFRCCADAH